MTAPSHFKGYLDAVLPFAVLLDDYNGGTVGGEIKLPGWLYS